MDWKAMNISHYRCAHDKVTGVFRVLNLWDDSIKNIPENELDKEIPDNSPAVKVLNTEEVNSLLEKLKELGWLEKYASANNNLEYKHIERTPTVHEVAINSIEKIIESKAEESISREGIMAIREIIAKL